MESGFLHMTPHRHGDRAFFSASARALQTLCGLPDLGTENYQISLDLMTHTWIVYYDLGDGFTLSSRLNCNNPIITRWIVNTGLTSFYQAPDHIINISVIKKRNWIMIKPELASGCYAIFLRVPFSLRQFEKMCVGPMVPTSFKQKAIEVYRVVIEAAKTPICYLDELVSHFEIPPPSGFKYMALLRLFRVTNEDTDTGFVPKRQHTAVIPNKNTI